MNLLGHKGTDGDLGEENQILKYVGGIVGLSTGKILNCSVSNISFRGTEGCVVFGGGIVGYLDGSNSDVEVSSCYVKYYQKAIGVPQAFSNLDGIDCDEAVVHLGGIVGAATLGEGHSLKIEKNFFQGYQIKIAHAAPIIGCMLNGQQPTANMFAHNGWSFKSGSVNSSELKDQAGTSFSEAINFTSDATFVGVTSYETYLEKLATIVA